MSGRKPFEEALDHIFWCDACNVSLIADVCGACGGPVRAVQLSPPGDVRFCSPFERAILHRLLTDTYGADPIGERLVLLNKIPGDDKADEVIVDGRTLAVMAYDLVKQDYLLDLRPDGAKVLMPHATKRIVNVDVPREKHLNGKGISGSCVTGTTPDVKAGDVVLLKVNESFNGLGVARVDSDKLANPAENTIKVRKIGGSRVRLNDRKSTIADAVEANRKQLQSMEADAINVIRGIAGQHKHLPVTVSFSGGKDSLVVFHIARKSVDKLKAFFVDTGLEFPETSQFVERFAHDTGVEIKIQKAGNAFDQNFPAFGPPAKDFRWCCKVCKLGPITSLLNNTKGVITIDGKRRYESFQRGHIGTVERNPFVPGQVGVFPIKDWRAIEVWLYIYMEKLPYNPLYDLGFERIGCWLCPAALQAEYVRMKELHPAKFDEWQGKLHKWAEASGLSPEYVDLGFWRWKAHPPKMLNVAREKGISLKPRAGAKMSLSMIKGISPCTAGGYSLEGVLSVGKWPEPDALKEMLKTIGTPSYSEDLDVMLLRAGKGTSKMFAGGQIYASSDDRAYAQRLFGDTVRQVLRAALCSKCKICVKACNRRAIRIDGHLRVDESKCNRCGKCTRACVIARYYDKLTGNKENYPKSIS
ncbi:phosphoadenosine phosphosulfate reductase family protein [Methanocella sp. MCL-LM]|uniref:phosphoadenosine phosphosulfate reductase domain-containing protein n=1 Tax=Methanocella sp. MCL-LM TaxID=3412035 RepID=UPI003C782AF3